ncbi:MAG: regulatory protein RecX [Thiotrichaceae bacterium]
MSEARFTESFIRSRRNKGYGPIRIRYELQQHGIVEPMLSELLDSHDPQWTRVARRERHKKFGTSLSLDLKQKAKQIRFLQYRGFSTAQIKEAFMSSEADEE